MLRTVSAALCLAALAALPALGTAAEYVLVWNGPIDNGIEMRIPGFFAGAVGAANPGVHLVIGDRADWDSCAHRVDLGEIRRRGFDGWTEFDIGGLIETPPFYAFFVRGPDHAVHTTHEVFYTRPGGRPVIPLDAGPPGAPGQPRLGGGAP